MFSFSTTHAAPIPVTIDGKTYQVPRFLQPDLAKWVAHLEEKVASAALAQLEDRRERARFLFSFQPPPVDMLDALDRTRTPEGVEYVLRTCLTAAGVDAETIDKLIKFGDTVDKSVLVRKLTETDAAGPVIDALAGNEEQEPSDDPLSNTGDGGTPISDAAPSTGASSTPSSGQPTPATTPTD